MKIKDFSSLKDLRDQIGFETLGSLEMSEEQNEFFQSLFPPYEQPIIKFDGLEIKII